MMKVDLTKCGLDRVSAMPSRVVPKWNEPEMPEEVLKNAKRAYDAMRRVLH